MRAFFLVIIFICFAFAKTYAQDYKLDNKVYTTISWNEFFNRLQKNPKLVFFDIRTAGERNDTSQYAGNNQGRIRGAIPIDYYQFEKYYPELFKHRQDTVYLYCSHSMRSRRLAKQLHDSAFKNVVSVNGGMSYLNVMGNKTFPLRSKYYETSLQYKLVSPIEFGQKLANKNVQVVDIRPDSFYNRTGGDEQDTSYGVVEGVLHIDNAHLEENIKKFDRKKEIVLIDNYGDLTPAAANLLISKGYKNVGILLFGLDQLRNKIPSAQRSYLKSNYTYILSSELLDLKKTDKIVIIDIRPESEFNGIDTVPEKNIGRIKGAVNIPFEKLSTQSLEPFRDKKIILYDYVMIPPELYKAADLLMESGIRDFSLLSGGIFLVNWEIANTDKKFLEELLQRNQ